MGEREDLVCRWTSLLAAKEPVRVPSKSGVLVADEPY